MLLFQVIVLDHLATVQLLVDEYGVHPDHVFNTANSNRKLSNMQTESTAENSDGFTPLTLASQHGRVNILRYMLSTLKTDESFTFEKHRDNRNKGILDTAIREGQLELIQFVVDTLGCDMEACQLEPPAVIVATQHAQWSLLRYFLQDLHLDPNTTDQYGRGMCFYLATHTASSPPNADFVAIWSWLASAARDSVDLDRVDADGEVCMHAAIRHQNWTAVSNFLNIGADAFTLAPPTQHGDTFLHQICRSSDSTLSNVRSLLQLLIVQHKLGVNLCNDDSQTPLLVAASSGRFDIAQELMHEFKADPSWFDNNRRSVLHLAVAQQQLAFVRSVLPLLRAEVVDARDCKGNTAAIIAAEVGNVEILSELLLNGKSSLQPRNHVGLSTLMTAAAHGNIDAVTFLCTCQHPSVRGKIDLGALSRFDRKSVFVRAAQDQQWDMLCLLLEHTQARAQDPEAVDSITVTSAASATLPYAAHARQWDIVDKLFNDFQANPDGEIMVSVQLPVSTPVTSQYEQSLMNVQATKDSTSSGNSGTSTTPIARTPTSTSSARSSDRKSSKFPPSSPLSSPSSLMVPQNSSISHAGVRRNSKCREPAATPIAANAISPDALTHIRTNVFVFASECGRWDVIRRLMPRATHANFELRGVMGNTLLASAALDQKWTIVRSLISEYGVNANVPVSEWVDRDAATAISDGNYAACRCNQYRKGYVLELAAAHGIIDLVRLLVESAHIPFRRAASYLSSAQSVLHADSVTVSSIKPAVSGRSSLSKRRRASFAQILGFSSDSTSTTDSSSKSSDQKRHKLPQHAVTVAEPAVVASIMNGHFNIADYLIDSQHASFSADHASQTLHVAVEHGQIETVEYVVARRGADVNFLNASGCSAIAKVSHNLDIMRFLVNRGSANASTRDNQGNSLLMQIASNATVPVCKFLFQKYPRLDVNEQSSMTGLTATMIAAQSGNLKLLQFLTLERKADVHMRCTSKNINAAVYAGEAGHWDVVKLLVQKCNADTSITTPSVKNRTLLHMAVDILPEKRAIELCTVLLESAPTDIDAVDNRQRTALVCALEHKRFQVAEYLMTHWKPEVNTVRTTDGSPLVMFACRAKQIQLVSIMVNSLGADINITNDSGKTSLMEACLKKQTDIVKRLVTELGARTDVHDEKGRSIIASAIVRKDEELVRWLVSECSVDVNHRDEHGNTPLHVAVESRCAPIVEFLVTQGNATANVCNDDGITPLMLAVRPGFRNDWSGRRKFSWDMANILLQHSDADINAVDSENRTALMRVILHKGATTIDPVTVVQYLAQQTHIDVRHRDNDGKTAFAHAVERGRLDVVRLLAQQAHADVDPIDVAGLTPLLRAVEAEDTQAVELICQLATERTSPGRMNAAQHSEQHVMPVGGLHLPSPDANKNSSTDSNNDHSNSSLFPDPTKVPSAKLRLQAVVRFKKEGASTHVPGPVFPVPDSDDSKHNDTPLLEHPRAQMDWSCDPEGSTPLVRAAARNSIEIVEMLLKSTNMGLPRWLNHRNMHGLTAIDMAIENSAFESTMALLECDSVFTPIDVVERVAEDPVWSRDLNKVRALYTQIIAFTDMPILQCLRCARSCAGLASSVHHVAHHDQYEQLYHMFTVAASKLLDELPSDHVAGWVLTQSDSAGECPLSVALDSHNVEFTQSARLNRIFAYWWSSTWKCDARSVAQQSSIASLFAVCANRTGLCSRSASVDSDEADSAVVSSSSLASAGHGAVQLPSKTGDSAASFADLGRDNKFTRTHAKRIEVLPVQTNALQDAPETHMEHLKVAFQEPSFPAGASTVETLQAAILHPMIYFHVPRVKFYLEMASFCTFLLLFVWITSQRIDIGAAFQMSEYMLCWFCFAYTLQQVAEGYATSWRVFWASGWNKLDVTICASVSMYIAVRALGSYGRVEQAIFSVASVLTILALSCRALFLFTLHDSLGPLLLVLAGIIDDVRNYVALMFVFLFGFSLSMVYLFGGGTSTVGTPHVDGFEDFGESVLTLFGGMFGNLEFTIFDRSNVFEVSESNRVIGIALACMYMLIAAVLLVNLLIAMMTQTYTTVRNKFAAEYIFSRVKTIWQYDQTRNILHPPFNILVYSIYFAIHAVQIVRGQLCCKLPNRTCDSKTAKVSPAPSDQHHIHAVLDATSTEADPHHTSQAYAGSGGSKYEVHDTHEHQALQRLVSDESISFSGDNANTTGQYAQPNSPSPGTTSMRSTGRSDVHASSEYGSKMAHHDTMWNRTDSATTSDMPTQSSQERIDSTAAQDEARFRCQHCLEWNYTAATPAIGTLLSKSRSQHTSQYLAQLTPRSHSKPIDNERTESEIELQGAEICVHCLRIHVPRAVVMLARRARATKARLRSRKASGNTMSGTDSSQPAASKGLHISETQTGQTGGLEDQISQYLFLIVIWIPLLMMLVPLWSVAATLRVIWVAVVNVLTATWHAIQLKCGRTSTTATESGKPNADNNLGATELDVSTDQAGQGQSRRSSAIPTGSIKPHYDRGLSGISALLESARSHKQADLLEHVPCSSNEQGIEATYQEDLLHSVMHGRAVTYQHRDLTRHLHRRLDVSHKLDRQHEMLEARLTQLEQTISSLVPLIEEHNTALADRVSSSMQLQMNSMSPQVRRTASSPAASTSTQRSRDTIASNGQSIPDTVDEDSELNVLSASPAASPSPGTSRAHMSAARRRRATRNRQRPSPSSTSIVSDMTLLPGMVSPSTGVVLAAKRSSRGAGKHSRAMSRMSNESALSDRVSATQNSPLAQRLALSPYGRTTLNRVDERNDSSSSSKTRNSPHSPGRLQSPAAIARQTALEDARRQGNAPGIFNFGQTGWQ
jgi:ankyrin repeat protein